jgi:hypothetical protein
VINFDIHSFSSPLLNGNRQAKEKSYKYVIRGSNLNDSTGHTSGLPIFELMIWQGKPGDL